MTSLSSVSEAVKAEALKKSDIATNLQSTILTVGQEGVKLRMGSRGEYGFTDQGLTSVLHKINVPAGFFRRSSNTLQRSMIEEHFPQKNKQDVFLRLHDKSIRFVASSKYGFYDDVKVTEALEKVDDLGKYKLKVFHQDMDHFILRFTTANPLNVPGSRPIFPGVHIENSETGLSTVKIQFLLFEQVCTNGMIVTSETFKAFNKKHLGNKDDPDYVSRAASFILSQMDGFIGVMEKHVTKARSITAEKMIETMYEDSRIPKVIKESLESKMSAYLTEGEEPTAVEALSAYTDAIQRYNWNSRTTYEEYAGEMLTAIA